MVAKYLAVDSNVEFANSEAKGWAKRKIGMERVDTMLEGIEKILQNDYLYIGINSDAVNFMPLLSTMRSITSTPIFVSTENFSTKTEVTALLSGADLYAQVHRTTEDNIESILAHIARKSERINANQPPVKVLIYKNLLVAPSHRYVFVDDKKICLTRQEFDILHVLMENHEKALTYGQIYKHVWGCEYVDSARHILWNAIKRLREKLKIGHEEPGYIETVRDYGYRFGFNDSNMCNA